MLSSESEKALSVHESSHFTLFKINFARFFRLSYQLYHKTLLLEILTMKAPVFVFVQRLITSCFKLNTRPSFLSQRVLTLPPAGQEGL